MPELDALDNVVLAARLLGPVGAVERARAAELLRRVGLGERSHHVPARLSGGERQRVAIARALMNRPSLILADEPTGNLDSENSEIVLEMLQKLNRELNQTIVMITHNPEAAAVAARTVHMRDGMIVGEK